jgi:hypothetical protein
VCPSCGSGDLSKASSIDVEKVTGNPARRLLGSLGAPLYNCNCCHLQFYDFRPLLTRPEKITFAVNFRR